MKFYVTRCQTKKAAVNKNQIKRLHKKCRPAQESSKTSNTQTVNIFKMLSIKERQLSELEDDESWQETKRIIRDLKINEKKEYIFIYDEMFLQKMHYSNTQLW